jgi:hypothetical protein
MVLAVLALVSVGSPLEEPSPPADRVIVVGLAGLRWDDVDRIVTPNLAELTDRGSVGALSVRSAPSVTCPAEGWLTLGAGTYAAVKNPSTLDPADGCAARPIPAAQALGDGAVVPETASLNEDLRFGADPGWLADKVGCVTAVGPGAALAGADRAGTVAVYHPTLPADLGPCPVALVDAGALPETEGRDEALQRFDRLLGQVRAASGRDTVLMVLGVSETSADQARLHVAVATGPGFGYGWLDSRSTRRIPYVQLSDVAPTVVRSLGLRYDDTIAGRPISGERDGRPSGLVLTRRALTDLDTRAVEQRRVLPGFFVGLSLTVAAVAATATYALWPRSRRPRFRGAARTMAVGLAGVPAATFLANLVPWWRSSAPLLAVYGAVAVGAAAILASAVGLAARVRPLDRRVRAQVGMVAAITVLAFAADAFTGSTLQINSLLGYNPVVAGRFTGFGNIAFAALGAATIILATGAAQGRPQRQALIAVALITLPVIVLDGSPQWGADFGGVLTLVPAFAVLAMLVAQVSVTWRRLALAMVGGAVAVGAIGWLDYLRPEDARTHFGRFVGSVLEGGAADTILRKLLANLELLVMGPHTIAALALTIVLVTAVFRPPASLQRAYAHHAMLRPMLQATVALALFGLATNDSGVAIPAVITLVTLPATMALALSVPTRSVTCPPRQSAAYRSQNGGQSDAGAGR